MRFSRRELDADFHDLSMAQGVDHDGASAVITTKKHGRRPICLRTSTTLPGRRLPRDNLLIDKTQDSA